MLQRRLGIEKIHSMCFCLPTFNGISSPTFVAVNRLDRLTSGLLILPLTLELARTMGKEFVEGKVKKEYIARVHGEFTEYVLSYNLADTLLI